MAAARPGHPDWCVTDPDRYSEHWSRKIVVEPGHDGGATVRAWLALPHASPARQPSVSLEVEDLTSRDQHPVPIGLARQMIEVFAVLGRHRTTGTGHTSSAAHPQWCTRQEHPGEPHRSRELIATIPHDDRIARIWLTQGSDGPEAPMTWVSLEALGGAYAWPPLTMAQHDTFVGRLTLLLDQQQTGTLQSV